MYGRVKWCGHIQIPKRDETRHRIVNGATSPNTRTRISASTMPFGGRDTSIPSGKRRASRRWWTGVGDYSSGRVDRDAAKPAPRVRSGQ